MTARAALAAIDAAVEEWLASDNCRIRELSPRIALALHASGYEIVPAGLRPAPASVQDVACAVVAEVFRAGLELRPARQDPAA